MSDAGSEPFVWAMIVAIGAATFLIRFAPIALLARLELPTWLTQALRYVPPAVMAAIIAPPLFFAGGAPTMDADPARIGAAGLATLIAWQTRSTLWTVLVGMLALWGLQALLG